MFDADRTHVQNLIMEDIAMAGSPKVTHQYGRVQSAAHDQSAVITIRGRGHHASDHAPEEESTPDK